MVHNASNLSIMKIVCYKAGFNGWFLEQTDEFIMPDAENITEKALTINCQQSE
jgi:hypothetical protein